MKSLWNDREGTNVASDPLASRVYSSRLLGQEPTLVLHGGGNTSVKAASTNLLGDVEEVLYVKGSGWDLATIEAAGFAPVRLDVARRMATLGALSDTDMVRILRAAMIDPGAPNPSVETILHAIIPFRYVDHTHADAVVTVTNTERGAERLRELYGDRVLVVPYVMPGFLLAKTVYEMTRKIQWTKLDGIILAHHGVFTFGDEAKRSYEGMIRLVSEAEGYLERHGAALTPKPPTRRGRRSEQADEFLKELARLRQAVSRAAGRAMLAALDDGPEAVAFSTLPNVSSIATRGPLTPDHVIRTKRIPVILGERIDDDIARYATAYRAYFERYASGELTCLDPAPRWVVWPGNGNVTFGRTIKDVEVVSDISRHTMRALQWGEALGGWKALSGQALFDVEYWALEQAKLKQTEKLPALQGKVAVVTGAASGIGRACAEALHAQGAVVAALDINPDITNRFTHAGLLGLVCDVTNRAHVQNAVKSTVRRFGGLDLLISNAGIFPASEAIAEVTPETWHQSMAVNLYSHQCLLQACIPYLSLGVDPAVVIIASKNVPAPGPGVSAYSVAKAGLTQLARVAALELGSAGIRVNVIHPNQVFDTAIWTPEVLAQRAHGMGWVWRTTRPAICCGWKSRREMSRNSRVRWWDPCLRRPPARRFPLMAAMTGSFRVLGTRKCTSGFLKAKPCEHRWSLVSYCLRDDDSLRV